MQREPLCRYENTERRAAEVAEKGIKYIGMGVSGGEEGARNGERLLRVSCWAPRWGLGTPLWWHPLWPGQRPCEVIRSQRMVDIATSARCQPCLGS